MKVNQFLSFLAGRVALAGCVAVFGPLAAHAVTIPANLDQEVNESGNEDASDNGVIAVSYGSNGSGTSMNARYNGSGGSATAGDGTITGLRNDFVVVRFDTSGTDKSTILNGALNFVLNRTSSNNGKDQRIWGVNSGVADLNNFAEGSAFGDTPGFMEDNDITTQSVVDADTTFLGTFNIISFLGSDPGAGNSVSINQAMLDGSGPNETTENTIDGFLQSLGASDQAVFIIGGINSGGQLRFNTKEGDFPPTLTFDVIPEPASLVLLGLSSLVLTTRRRG